jgi:hypothetical protein
MKHVSVFRVFSLNVRMWRGRKYLFSPLVDVMLAGGVAWAVLPILFMLAPPLPTGQVNGMLVYYVSVAFAVLAYGVNHPHFMASYHLLYASYGEKLRTHRANTGMYLRYVWAGIVAPAMLVGYLIYAFASQEMSVFAIGVQIMYFTVGWHYVKQAFGVFIMLSVLKNVYYSTRMRRLLLVNCWLVWMLSWLGSNVLIPNSDSGALYDLWGVTYHGLGFPIPPHVMKWLKMLVIGYGIAVVVAIMVQAWRTRRLPSLSALAGYSTIYTLLLLSYLHPLWIYMTPLLHSAQYLLFVAAYKRGEAALSEQTENEASTYNGSIKRYIAIMLWLGILSFTAIPEALIFVTGGMAEERGLFLPFMYAFTIFINIHHYFIDNVIWRKENTQVSKYLFYQKAVA